MDNLVTTLETSKRLKEAGFPQVSIWSWETRTNADNHKHTGLALISPQEEWEAYGVRHVYCAAPTAQEIADQLPWRVESVGYLQIGLAGAGTEWFARYTGLLSKDSLEGYGKTMAEALALLWLKLQAKS